jgi:hypothetical protein
MNLALPRFTGPGAVVAEPSGFDPDTGKGFLTRGRVLGMIGPAFVAAVAFVDPGTLRPTSVPVPTTATPCCGRLLRPA